MARLNLILDGDTYRDLKKHANRLSRRPAGLARELVREGIQRREAAERRRALARYYTAGRKDARASLDDLELPQMDLLDGDET